MSIIGSAGSERALGVGRLKDFYPSPFFELAGTYLPSSINSLFEWCLYYQLTNPIISAVTSRLAAYPVTDIDIKSEDAAVCAQVQALADSMHLRRHLIEVNLDRYTFGNAYSSVMLPIQKVLHCRSCANPHAITEVSYRWIDYSFHIQCKKCRRVGPARVEEVKLRNPKRIKLIRWNPMNVEVNPCGVPGSDTYEYQLKLSRSITNRITLGHKATIESVPQAFIDAVKRRRKVAIDASKIFHSKRPSASRQDDDSAYGLPLIFPVLKDLFFLQVLRKAQEAVAMEHIVPMRVLFPAVRSGTDNPYANVDLRKHTANVTQHVEQWKRDINHIPVLSVPIDYRVIGGQGRGLLLHQEIRLISEFIISGLGVPVSFFYGEAEYSGASVNLKGLENEFQANRYDTQNLINFIFEQTFPFLGLIQVPVGQKPFKMADDIQRLSFNFQLNQTGKISDRTLVTSAGLDYDNEQRRISKEAPAVKAALIRQSESQAEAQGKGTIIATRYQLEAQEMQQQFQMAQQEQAGQAPMNQEQQLADPSTVYNDTGMSSYTENNPNGERRYLDAFSEADSMASRLSSQELTSEQVEQELANIERSNPRFATMVRARLGKLPGNNDQDANPLPKSR